VLDLDAFTRNGVAAFGTSQVRFEVTD